MINEKSKIYMLFLYGVWLDSEFITRMTSSVLIPLRSEGLVKFVNGSLSSVITFKSKKTLEEIHSTINEKLPDLVNMFFLIEKPNDITYRLPDWMEKHLFDVDTFDENSPYITKGDFIGKDNPSDNLNDIDVEFNLENDIGIEEIMKDVTNKIDNLLTGNNPKYAEVNMDLDEILDKVSRSGIDSLTQREKNFLDKYNNQ